MAQATTLLIDDQDPQIQYLCPTIHQIVAGSYYNNTWSTVNSDDCSKGWFQYTFYGTGVYIQTAVASSGASYSVKIDDGNFITQSGSGPYTSPMLADGKHTITYATSTASSPPVFDYLTVTPSQSTSPQGRTLAVDDFDDSVKYSGSWSTKSPSAASFDYSTSLYRGTTHWSSKIGDSLQFEFEGSSISVFGIAANLTSGGNITTTYILDGVPNVQKLPPGTLDTLPMVKLFHADVQPGAHTLVVNITDIQPNRALGIDLITYNATFDSLPSVPVNAAPSSATEAVSSLSSGAKAGIAIGTLVGVALLCLSVYAVTRRQLRKRFDKFAAHTLDSESDIERPTKPQHTW